MTDKIIRTGIAGSGFAARFHYEALQRLFSVKAEVKGAFSPTSGNLMKAGSPMINKNLHRDTQRRHRAPQRSKN